MAWIKAKCTLKFWLEQVLDIAIAVVIVLCVLDVTPWMVAIVVIAAYVALYSIYRFRCIWNEEKEKLKNGGSYDSRKKHKK